MCKSTSRTWCWRCSRRGSARSSQAAGRALQARAARARAPPWRCVARRPQGWPLAAAETCSRTVMSDRTLKCMLKCMVKAVGPQAAAETRSQHLAPWSARCTFGTWSSIRNGVCLQRNPSWRMRLWRVLPSPMPATNPWLLQQAIAGMANMAPNALLPPGFAGRCRQNAGFSTLFSLLNHRPLTKMCI